MMMGTCEEKIEDVNKLPENLTVILDDFDIGITEEIQLHNREENLNKVSQILKILKKVCKSLKKRRS